MNLKIVCPHGIGRGTKIWCDGIDITAGVTHVAIEIPADDIVTITIKRNFMHENRIYITENENGEKEIATEVFKFVGDNFVLTEPGNGS